MCVQGDVGRAGLVSGVATWLHSSVTDAGLSNPNSAVTLDIHDYSSPYSDQWHTHQWQDKVQKSATPSEGEAEEDRGEGCTRAKVGGLADHSSKVG